MVQEFSLMFEPMRVGNVQLKNRLMQPAHNKLYAVNGALTARDQAYYEERAKHGVGLLVVGGRAILRTSAGQRNGAVGDREDTLEADRRVTDAIHRHGATVFAQINHFGVNAAGDGVDELHELWSSSPLPSPLSGTVAREMGTDEIQAVVEAWADAAFRVKRGGFDGVEILMGHGYLLHQFMSPLHNKRTDEYGPRGADRFRLLVQVMSAVRERVGDDFVVGVRLSLTDAVPGGIETSDVIELLEHLSPHRVDYASLSGPGYHAFHLSLPGLGGPRDGWLADRAQEVKAAFPDLPIFLVGGFRNPTDVDNALASGAADVIALNRAQIADPQWVQKARGGRADEIRPCIRANQGCFGRVARGLPMACTVNPAAGRERLFAKSDVKVAEAKKWLVVGGGPAGMHAAVTLARRGHDVTLAEQASQLGGQVNLAASVQVLADLRRSTDYLSNELDRLSVRVILGRKIDAADLVEFDVDQVVIATGARPDSTGFSSLAPLTAKIEGVERPNVLTAWDAIRDGLPRGSRVAILDDDGSRRAAAVALKLKTGGASIVHITTRNALFPETAPTMDQPVIYGNLFDGEYDLRVNTWVNRIDQGSITAYNLYSQVEETVQVDYVVLATRPHSDDALYRDLRVRGMQNVHAIGDCVAPRALDHALFDAHVVGTETPVSDLPELGDMEKWGSPDASLSV